MKLKWQWFVGGRVMFWMTIIAFFILVFGFVTTYVIDPIVKQDMKIQKIDPSSIKELSEKYVKSLRYKN